MSKAWNARWGGALSAWLCACGVAQQSSSVSTAADAASTEAEFVGADRAGLATAMRSSSLIPRRVLFGNPERTQLRISPDGQHLAYLAPVDGVLNVWVAPPEDLSQATPVTDDRKRGIRSFNWSYRPGVLLFAQDKGGDENWHVYAVHTPSRTVRDLTPLANVQARLQQVSPMRPDSVVVALNERNPRLHDLFNIDLESGRRELLEKNEQGFARYVLDDRYRVRLAMRMERDGGLTVLTSKDSGWSDFARVAPEDMLQSQVYGFDESAEYLYISDSTGRDTAALYEVSMHTGQRRLLAAHDRSDVGGLMVHPQTRRAEAVRFDPLRQTWTFLDPQVQEHFAHLQALGRGDYRVISRTLDDAKWVVARTVDDGPVRYYLYDTAAREASVAFSDRPSLESLKLARMHARELSSRDGLRLPSFLTLPKGSDADADGVPDAPVPMMLWVHGGPWRRDRWGFNSTHQWLADRGYAVLSVNYRGSTGYGKTFTNAGDGEWAANMHDDLLDAVSWAVERGIADPERVAIGGKSYGGYATLVGLTFTPDRFACGVDIVGPSNLVTLLDNIPPFWAPILPLLTNRVGDPRTKQGRALLQERSPLSRASQITKPLLIGQGANDPRVKQAEADQIVAALNANRIPVVYALYPDEGHGFVRPPNRLSFFGVAEAFLASCLGGAQQPLGDDLKGSSLQMPVGAEQLGDVEKALEARTHNP